MATSGDTVLRVLRRVALPEPPVPRIVGVDDWAHCRGRVYGAILVDLERHEVLDLLPDRSADSVAAWLAQHPGVSVVSRDRWQAFADGIRRGAPAAVHVLDRFHLVKNLGGALENLFHRQHTVLDEAAAELR